MTEQELEFHMGGIGGSDAPVVMGKSPWRTRLQLWELKTRRTMADPPSYPMLKGIRMEPVARKAYERETGIEMPKDQAKHKKYDYVRCNLDGVNWDEGRALEIKCPGRVDHALAVKGQIPLKYLYQCVHILAATDLDLVDYYSYHEDQYSKKVSTARVPYKRNKRLEELLLSKEAEFWELVEKDIAPEEEPTEAGPFKVRKDRSRIVSPKRKVQIQKPELTIAPVLELPKDPSVAQMTELLTRAKAMGAHVRVEIIWEGK